MRWHDITGRSILDEIDGAAQLKAANVRNDKIKAAQEQKKNAQDEPDPEVRRTRTNLANAKINDANATYNKKVKG